MKKRKSMTRSRVVNFKLGGKMETEMFKMEDEVYAVIRDMDQGAEYIMKYQIIGIDIYINGSGKKISYEVAKKFFMPSEKCFKTFDEAVAFVVRRLTGDFKTNLGD
jgi:hypothetical protein